MATSMNDNRWASVVARNGAADGTFFYSVRTTGVYCRPSCGARLPKPQNVAFHDTAADAEHAGFRPCKRCRPTGQSLAEQHAHQVAALCEVIRDAEHAPSLHELAARAGWSAYHLHRVFKAVTGLTPSAYAAAHRAERVRAKLASSDTVTQAIYDAGYNSSSRFYERSSEILGMSASTYRAGGEGTEIRFAIGECSLGRILVAATSHGVCAVSLGDKADLLERELRGRFARATFVEGDESFERLVKKLIDFVEAPRIGLDLPLDVRGTAFQKRVWDALRSIPAGETASYTEVAERIGAPTAVRAVARACAQNTLALAIPCHRVVRTDGTLSGYRWGVERKRALLEREASEVNVSRSRSRARERG